MIRERERKTKYEKEKNRMENLINKNKK